MDRKFKKKRKKQRLNYLIWCFNMQVQPSNLFKWKSWTKKQEIQMWKKEITSKNYKFIELSKK